MDALFFNVKSNSQIISLNSISSFDTIERNSAKSGSVIATRNRQLAGGRLI